MLCDRIWTDARLATLSEAGPGLGIVEDGLVAARGGTILYAGSRRDAPPELAARETTRLDGRWVTPPLHCGLLGGIGRALYLNEGRLVEAVVRVQDLPRVQAFAFVNSLRGWLDARLV